MNEQSVLKLVSDVKLVTAKSSKTQQPYTYLAIELTNGESINLYSVERGYITLLNTLVKLQTKQ